jgi:hypothetical protein
MLFVYQICGRGKASLSTIDIQASNIEAKLIVLELILNNRQQPY